VIEEEGRLDRRYEEKEAERGGCWRRPPKEPASVVAIGGGYSSPFGRSVGRSVGQ
jgi:hypothetical protein